jgi:hypothetical protein
LHLFSFDQPETAESCRAPELGLITTISDLTDSHKCPDGGASSELLLVLACARASIWPASVGEIRQVVAGQVDFLKAINLASRHGLAPCLIQQLLEHAAAALPESVVVEFRRWLRAHTLRSMQLTSQLVQILDRLKEQEIRALAFKGPVLAQQLYDQPFRREFVDLDILVPAEAVGQVIALLGADGFGAQFRLTSEQLARFQKNWCEMGLYDRAKDILVEIHWELFPPGYSFSPATEIAWEATGEVFIVQRPITTLSIENQLLFACLHQAKHNWSRLGWILDLAVLVKQSTQLNWEKVEHRAGGFGTARMIRVSLKLVENLFDVPLPSTIGEWVARDKQSERIARRAEQRLLSADADAGEPMRMDPLFRAAMESKRDRAVYWWHLIFRPTPLEWAMVPLPDWLWWLYYPVRAGRLLVKQAAGSLNALFNGSHSQPR